MKKEMITAKQLFLVAIDLCIVLFCAAMSLLLRFDFLNVPQRFIVVAWNTIWFDMIITVIVFWSLRLYHSIWTFVSVREIGKVIIGSLIIGAAKVAFMTISNLTLPRSYYVFNVVLMIVIFSASRMSVRIYRGMKQRRANKAFQKRTMLIGAGSAGDMLIRELDTYSDSANNIVCVIDDNPSKIGQYLGSRKIVGTTRNIQEQAEEYAIDEIIIAIPSATHAKIKEIIDICKKTNCRIKTLPLFAKTMTEGSLKESVRDISIEDLLGREEIITDLIGLNKFINDKVVMVTGGGGSIGSELCRQIVQQNPKQLIIFDIYENSAYEIQQEIKRKNGDANVQVLIGSVRDQKRMEEVFKEYRPNVVYHAAAHKHVPLMEDSPKEAIKNNCLGTLNVASLADKYKADNFILISTDKAVRPTNVMGATKRLCEMIVHMISPKSMTKFAAVRFGNVLGSNGSVIPLFQKQIDEGGPVTVTHKDITRFFMTIPEAVALVLEAGLYARGGEIFILDMGEPVKIYDVAKSVIRARGFTPNKDMPISIVGLRPGEKLYEEILMEEEGLRTTENKLIHIGNPIEFDHIKFEKALNELVNMSYNESCSNESIKILVQEICPTYTITNN